MTALLLGHRGNPAEHAENTLDGFRSAVACGADGVELDVQLTRDAVPVVLHDDSLRRTAGVDRRVDALTWQELEALGTGVPRLDAVLDALRDHTIAVELKPPHATAPQLSHQVLRIARDAGAERLILLAFDHAHLSEARRHDRGVSTGALVGERPADPGAVLDACGADFLAARWEHVDAALCDAVRAAGRQVIAWTVDDPGVVRALLRLGVHALISNRPCVLARALRDDRGAT